jgi:dGTPase
MLTIREKIERNERAILSEFAALSSETRGRNFDEPKCDLRTDFQRDRDRVIHCASFRRLKHKTQVFLAPEGDHYRTRLTHTLEVSQVARTIARSLFLNEDLTEAISLAHDLGHTPFGHAGERALNEMLSGGFRHFEQSVRVVNKLEKGGRGLNLTKEVQNGILCHTRGERAFTLEGRIVEMADKIAYMNHDIDDAIKAGVLKETDIPKELRDILGDRRSARINNMVKAVVSESYDDIKMAEPYFSAYLELQKFLFASVYTNPVAKGEEVKAESLVKSLFTYYRENPEKLPDQYHKTVEEEGAYRAAADYIAGMTDHYAIAVYQSLFVPKAWQG